MHSILIHHSPTKRETFSLARIIIVDDDTPFREMLTEVLTNEGHEIVDASDGNIGLEVLILKPVDIAIVDLFMPNRDGMATIRDITNLFPRTKIIAISGASLTPDEGCFKTAKTIGAHYTLPKPFKPSELLHLIETIMNGSSSSSEAVSSPSPT
jgi:DNA-binding response OmpR family regulator